MNELRRKKSDIINEYRFCIHGGNQPHLENKPFGDAFVDLSVSLATPCSMIYDHYSLLLMSHYNN